MRSYVITVGALLLSAIACGGSPANQVPGAAGQPCNPSASGTDGCDATSVCVAQQSLCRPDCAQVSCINGGACNPYYSAHSSQTYSVCFPPGISPPPPVSSTGGGSGGSGGGTGNGSCGGGSAYCASCNVCLPQGGCGPYWCTSGSQAICGNTASLTGCTGPVHNGCDCASSSSSGGSSSTSSGGSSSTSSGGSSSSSGGSSGGPCTNVMPYVTARMSTNQFCKGYVAVTNGFSKQIACKYTTSSGMSGCVLPLPGANDCMFGLAGAASYSLVCADGQLACDQAIGCSL